jgi:hypothetical protein
MARFSSRLTTVMNDVLDRLRTFQSRLLLSLHGIPEPDLRRPESPGKWSIADVIAHLGDLELVTSVRIRTALAEENAPLPKLAQNEWVTGLAARTPFAELLESFWFHRRSNVTLLSRLTEEELSRTGLHPDYGPSSIRDLTIRVEAHEERHLRQIERIKTTHGITTSDQPDVTGVIAGNRDGDLRSPGQGIQIRELWSDGIRRALEVEFAPGAQWPGIDYHVPGPEEVYVLHGDFDDGANVYRTGAFLHHPAGSSHSPTSVGGCTLLVYYPEG